MAPPGKAAKGEAIWREAWVACSYGGEVELASSAETGQENLIVRCKEVAKEFGAEAEVVDDGRTVGVAIGDYVVFGVIKRPGKAPIAVNICRSPAPKKRRKAVEDFEDDFGQAKRRRKDLPPLPPALVGELIGIVRNQSSNSGDFFIECAKVYEEYERDAKIRLHEMPLGIELGDVISFEVDPPFCETAAPVARCIKRAAKDEADAALAKGLRKKGAKGGGKGGKSEQAGKGADKPAPRPRPPRPGVALMRMTGIVKRPSPTTGRHFIFCQDISDVCGKDAQIPITEVPEGGLRVGDRVAFDVEEPREGRQQETPWARNVKVIGPAAGGAAPPQEDVGDGEDDNGEEVELEERDDEAEDGLAAGGEDELEEADAADQLEAELSKLNDGLGEKKKDKAPQPKAARVLTAARSGGSAPVATKDPETTEGWLAAQERLFPGMPKLKDGWIRIRSKSRGLVYYYNVKSGESTPNEPRA